MWDTTPAQEFLGEVESSKLFSTPSPTRVGMPLKHVHPPRGRRTSPYQG